MRSPGPEISERTTASVPLDEYRELLKARDQLQESKAETAAAIEFMEAEMGWEYFREEFKLGGRASQSLENAEKLSRYLKEAGHGLKFLRQHADLVQQVKALTAMHGSGLCVWGRCVCGLDKLKANVDSFARR